MKDLTLLVREGHNVLALFSEGYFRNFLIHYKLSENQFFGGVFTVFWGNLEDVGTLIVPHPHSIAEMQ